MRSESMVVCTERRSVNGGHRTTSTASVSFLSSRYDSFCVNWMATKWSWCIFQLAAMMGVRSVMTGLAPRASAADGAVRCGGSRGAGGGLAQCLETRQVALLDELERGSPTRAHVVDLVREPELGGRGGAVATAHGRGPRA